MPEDRTLRITDQSDETIAEMLDWLKERRKSLKISQQLLSELTGIQRDYISEIENGHRPYISMHLFMRLVLALNGRVVIEEDYRV